jgi:integrase
MAADCQPHIRLAILLMLTTAGRVSAILDLTWDRVDFERGKVDLRLSATAPRKGRAVVPMNATLREALLEARPGAMTRHVVEWGGRRVFSIKNGFAAAVRSAGLSDVTPHVLRHTAAVHMAVAGVGMERIAQYLGHSSVQTTRTVYARFAPDHLLDAAAVLDFGIAAGRSTTLREIG